MVDPDMYDRWDGGEDNIMNYHLCSHSDSGRTLHKHAQHRKAAEQKVRQPTTETCGLLTCLTRLLLRDFLRRFHRIKRDKPRCGDLCDPMPSDDSVDARLTIQPSDSGLPNLCSL